MYIVPKSTTERPRKTKIGTEVAHITRDSDTLSTTMTMTMTMIIMTTMMTMTTTTTMMMMMMVVVVVVKMVMSICIAPIHETCHLRRSGIARIVKG